MSTHLYVGTPAHVAGGSNSIYARHLTGAAEPRGRHTRLVRVGLLHKGVSDSNGVLSTLTRIEMHSEEAPQAPKAARGSDSVG